MYYAFHDRIALMGSSLPAPKQKTKATIPLGHNAPFKKLKVGPGNALAITDTSSSEKLWSNRL